jgi:hypothetical protein
MAAADPMQVDKLRDELRDTIARLGEHHDADAIASALAAVAPKNGHGPVSGAGDPEADPRAAREAFARLLAGMEEGERKRALRAVEMLAMNRPAANLHEFELTTGEELAAERGEQIARLVEFVAAKGWTDRRLRLADTDAAALEARALLAKELDGERLNAKETDDLIDRVAYGLERADGVMDLRAEWEPYEHLIDGLIVSGFNHYWYGDRGTLKTLMLIWACCALASQGKHSLLFEYEMPGAVIQRMIDDMGFDRDEIATYFHIVDPREAGQPFSASLVGRYLARWPKTALVGLDNLGEALDDSGPEASENSAGDARRLLSIMRAVSRQGNAPAVITIDHTGVAGMRARGSTAKGQAVDVEFEFALTTKLTRAQAGKLVLSCRKDRTSDIGNGTKLAFDIGDGNGALPVVAADPNTDNSDPWGQVGAALREALRQYNRDARDAGAADHTVAQEKLCELAGIPQGKQREQAKTVLRAMAEQTFRSGVRITPVKRGQRVFYTVEWVEPEGEVFGGLEVAGVTPGEGAGE